MGIQEADDWRRVFASLWEIAAQGENWDGEGASAVDAGSAISVAAWLNQIMRSGGSTPNALYAIADGSIMMEFDDSRLNFRGVGRVEIIERVSGRWQFTLVTW